MERDRIFDRITNLNVNPRHYSITGEIKDNAYNIELLNNGRYATYYLERGEKVNFRTFDTEEEALLELLKSLEANIRTGIDLSS